MEKFDKIDFNKHGDEICHRLLIEAVTKLSKKKRDDFFAGWDGSHDHTFKLVVDNKIELSVRAVMTEWNKQINRMIEEKAGEMIEEKMSEMTEMMYLLGQQVKQNMKKILKASVNTMRSLNGHEKEPGVHYYVCEYCGTYEHEKPLCNKCEEID